VTGPGPTAGQGGGAVQKSPRPPAPVGGGDFPPPPRDALEFADVLEVVAGFAAGPLGAESVRWRKPSTSASWIRGELGPVAELLALREKNEAIDVAAVPPLDTILDRLRLEGSVLEGTELVAIRSTLSAARAASGELRRVAREAPLIAGWAVPLPEPAIDRRLAQALDESGEVLDTASPALQRARKEVQESRGRLIKKLEAVLRGLDARGDASVTMRNGRYVIPVRRDARSRPDGIVHDESASAETLFLEPSAAIELGNSHRAALAEAEREVVRVLRDLTHALRPSVSLIRDAHTMCVALDDLIARARYAHTVRGQVPEIVDAGYELELREARHPLLLARGIAAVPFDLVLLPGERTVLISGPNAGGKTVLLKTAGLAAALVQCGIVPPIGAGSRFPIFGRMVADIGDHQSIAADLSTFTAHVSVLRDVLDRAGPGTLVLMDEIGSGTDPAEGAALAGAALRALTRLGAVTIATTHLGSLKALATQAGGIVNGSLQFDAERLAPTFRFVKGTPGRSYGLAIAKRLGIRSDVLTEAEGQISTVERSLDALLQVAEARERELAAAQADLAARLGDAERESARLSEQAERQAAREGTLKAREKDAERRARTEARRVMLEAREHVEAALRAAQSARGDEAGTRARRGLEEAIKREGEVIEALERPDPAHPADAGAIQVGQRVRLGSGSVGRVVETRPDGNAVVVSGSVKVVVATGELTLLTGRDGRDPGVERTGGRERREGRDGGGPAPTEVDLRGLRVDEAEGATLIALDAAIRSDQPSLRIIHGMGTGAVREAVRRLLASDKRVRKYAFAPRNQGGTGVTVAEFAE